jgi:hypothetical protein
VDTSETVDVLFVATGAGALSISSADLGETDPFVEPALTITVTNPGPTTATGISLYVGNTSGTPAITSQAFIIGAGTADQCTGHTLPPHSTCTFQLRTANSLPTPGGVYSATLLVSAVNVHSISTTAKVTTVLQHAPVTFGKSGTGDGQITIAGLGAYCVVGNPTCSSYPIIDGETEHAVATAAAGSIFTQWSAGPCSGSTDPTCLLSGANHTPLTVTALFTKQ